MSASCNMDWTSLDELCKAKGLLKRPVKESERVIKPATVEIGSIFVTKLKLTNAQKEPGSTLVLVA